MIQVRWCRLSNKAPQLLLDELPKLEAGLAEADRGNMISSEHFSQAPAPSRIAVALDLFMSRRAAREIGRFAGWWVANRPVAPYAVRKGVEAALALLLRDDAPHA